MSRPQNVLNFYRSYAYHHILVACDGTQTAEALAKEGDLSVYDRATSSGGRFTPRTLGVNGGKYVILIDGTSDAHFTIRSAKWSSVLYPNEPGQQQTMASDGELVIQEALGVRFLNVLDQARRSLEIDFFGMIFLLKTIFVGHRFDQQTTTIANVRPLLFYAVDIGAIFSETGAEYTFAFVGVVNGAGKLPHVTAITDGFSFNIAEGSGPSVSKAAGGTPIGFGGLTTAQGAGTASVGAPTLKQVFKNLEDRLNGHYKATKQRLEQEARCAGVTLDLSKFVEVVYKFQLDPAYENYVAGDNETLYKMNKGENDPIVVQKGDNLSMESIITAIMNTSTQVVKEANTDPRDLTASTERTGENSAAKYVYKITSALNTDRDFYEVIYHIQRYEVAFIPIQRGDQHPWESFDPPKNQRIEFDYIFTGRNVDIKSFDIKMEMGLAFLQILATTNTMPTPGEIQSNQGPQSQLFAGGGDGSRGSAGVDTGEEGTEEPKKPLFLGMTLRDPVFRNKIIPGTTSTFNSLLSRHAALENLGARLVIWGNPQLLEESTPLPEDMDPRQNNVANVIETLESQQAEPDEKPGSILRAIHKVPAYVKVNVMMPRTAIVGADTRSADYAEPFWYTGWYHLISINNVFDDGEFIQELELISVPTDPGLSKLGSTECGTGTGASPGGIPASPDAPQEKLSRAQLGAIRAAAAQTRERTGGTTPTTRGVVDQATTGVIPPATPGGDRSLEKLLNGPPNPNDPLAGALNDPRKIPPNSLFRNPDYLAMIGETERKYNLPPTLLARTMYQESRGVINSTSAAGAKGPLVYARYGGGLWYSWSRV